MESRSPKGAAGAAATTAATDEESKSWRVLQREIAITRQLNAHPHIVRLLDTIPFSPADGTARDTSDCHFRKKLLNMIGNLA